jgi:hypothetical protein
MNLRPLLVTAVLAGTAVFSFAAAPVATPRQHPEVVAHPQTDSTDKVYPLSKIIPATVHDAWVLSDRNEEAFFDIVEQLAQVSAQNRGLSLPDNAAAGKRMGEIIKEKARADHDQLLYVIVDQAVRSVGTKAMTPAAK